MVASLSGTLVPDDKAERIRVRVLSWTRELRHHLCLEGWLASGRTIGRVVEHNRWWPRAGAAGAAVW